MNIFSFYVVTLIIRSQLILLTLVFLYGVTEGQDNISTAGKAYGSLRTQIAAYDDDIEIQDNSSRLGLLISHELENSMSFFSHLEWSLNLVGNAINFNTEASSESGFSSIQRETEEQTFKTRLGFLGMTYGKWGSISIGKQWSIYSDVARMADKLIVFGGEGNGSFHAGTDGSSTGVGRAEKALAY